MVLCSKPVDTASELLDARSEFTLYRAIWGLRASGNALLGRIATRRRPSRNKMAPNNSITTRSAVSRHHGGAFLASYPDCHALNAIPDSTYKGPSAEILLQIAAEVRGTVFAGWAVGNAGRGPSQVDPPDR